MLNNKIAAIVLAGGKGKRMQSDLPKVLHQIASVPMVFYTLKTLGKLGFTIFVVVQNEESPVKKEIEGNFDCHFAYQITPLGTGHALNTALLEIPESTDTLLVLNGDDSAFYSTKTLKEYLNSHKLQQAAVSALTLIIKDDRALGRIIRDMNGNFLKNLESKEYLASGLKSDEINCGCYIFEVKWLKENIKKLQLSMTSEFYITDLLNIAKKQGANINLFTLEDEAEWVGVNTQDDLKIANQMMGTKLKTS
jgi:bifunctional UDP-N-acetylglucosamine pyrophosphorylase / glucosamine-1-phosphate N-acetyltransferase